MQRRSCFHLFMEQHLISSFIIQLYQVIMDLQKLISKPLKKSFRLRKTCTYFLLGVIVLAWNFTYTYMLQTHNKKNKNLTAALFCLKHNKQQQKKSFFVCFFCGFLSALQQLLASYFKITQEKHESILMKIKSACNKK